MSINFNPIYPLVIEMKDVLRKDQQMNQKVGGKNFTALDVVNCLIGTPGKSKFFSQIGCLLSGKGWINADRIKELDSPAKVELSDRISGFKKKMKDIRFQEGTYEKDQLQKIKEIKNKFIGKLSSELIDPLSQDPRRSFQFHPAKIELQMSEMKESANHEIMSMRAWSHDAFTSVEGQEDSFNEFFNAKSVEGYQEFENKFQGVLEEYYNDSLRPELNMAIYFKDHALERKKSLEKIFNEGKGIAEKNNISATEDLKNLFIKNSMEEVPLLFYLFVQQEILKQKLSSNVYKLNSIKDIDEFLRKIQPKASETDVISTQLAKSDDNLQEMRTKYKMMIKNLPVLNSEAIDSAMTYNKRDFFKENCVTCAENWKLDMDKFGVISNSILDKKLYSQGMKLLQSLDTINGEELIDTADIQELIEQLKEDGEFNLEEMTAMVFYLVVQQDGLKRLLMARIDGIDNEEDMKKLLNEVQE
jgi:hypothetical protein